MHLNTVTDGLILTCLLYFLSVFSVAETKKVSSVYDAMHYLGQFGYLPNGQQRGLGYQITRQEFSKAIRRFQKFANLRTTGSLDADTIKMMNARRCANRDVEQLTNALGLYRSKRFATAGAWDKRALTWSVREFPPRDSATTLTDAQILQVVREAFRLWADGSNNLLTFTEVPKDSVRLADIDIRFTKGVLPNGLIFDGPDGLASYSFYPTNPDFPGDIYFDASEKWALKDDGINLLQVATQEIGHALGLAHSDDPNAVMWPFYVGFEENFQLGQDDINAIRALYGDDKPRLTGSGGLQPIDSASEAVTSKNVQPSTLMPPFLGFPITERPMTGVGASRLPFIPGPSATGASPNLAATDPCQVGFVPDAIVQTRDENMYLFKNNNYWLIRYTESKGIEIPAGYPKPISDWGNIQGPIDSAFTGLKGKTYLFKGKEYWKFDNMVKEGGYPRLIANGFPGIPDSIDASFVWPGDNLTYFVKNKQFYTYDPKRFPPTRGAQDLLLDGVHTDVHASFLWLSFNRAILISGTQLYGLSNGKFEIAEGFNFPAAFLYDCAEAANLHYGRPRPRPRTSREMFKRLRESKE
ncbi:hypothetical protein RvY_02613 [Ramazzottius varieornatus]|uniref:Peptidase metallopeptidase domain-containing protein n=1 Tax=Ramazzottius varieornatus TaxID=947166 RepID=A0A1D1UUV7_RAMVA|nr:hypothetical protein RvY_02613 [Ramazzottius varieornatus]